MKREIITPEFAQRIWNIFNDQGIDEAKQYHFHSGFYHHGFVKDIFSDLNPLIFHQLAESAVSIHMHLIIIIKFFLKEYFCI